MPEAAKDIHDSRDLDAGVSALVGDLEAARAEPVGGQDAPVKAAAEVPAQADDAAHTIDAAPAAAAPMPESVPAASDLASAAPAPEAPLIAAPAPAAEPPAQDLAQAVEQLIAESQPPPPPPAPEPSASTKIDSLDAELAGLADDLISGEFAADVDLMEAAQAPRAALEMPDSLPVESKSPAKPAPPPAPAAAVPPTPLALPPRQAAPAAAPAVAPAPAGAPAAVQPATPGRLAALGPVVLRIMTAVSAPLRGRPQHIRDAVGWIATVNAFLALCVWGYLLFLRPTDAAPPKPPAAASHAPEGAGDGSHSASHTPKDAKAGGHGAAAKKPEAKKPDDRKAAAKKTAAGGHH